MAEFSSESKESTVRGVSYSWAPEHLRDELQLLDLKIRLYLCKQRKRLPGRKVDFLAGLVISDEDIDQQLLGNEKNHEFRTEQDATSPDQAEQSLAAQIGALSSEISQRRRRTEESGILLPLHRLSRLFQLTPREEQCLIMCLAPDIDDKYDRIYAYVNDDITKKMPTPRMMLNILCETCEEKLSARPVFDSRSPLFKYGLLVSDEADKEPLMRRSVMMDARMADHLLGFQGIDARLHTALDVILPGQTQQPTSRSPMRNEIAALIRSNIEGRGPSEKNALVHLYGPYGAGKRSLVRDLAYDLKIPVLACDLIKITCGPTASPALLWLAAREAILQQGILCFENADCLLQDGDVNGQWAAWVLEVVKASAPVTVLLTEKPWPAPALIKEFGFAEFKLPVPDEAERKELWDAALMPFTDGSEIDTAVLAGKFRFTQGQIRDAVATAENTVRWRPEDTGRMSQKDLYASCRLHSNQKLSELAQKLDARYAWQDIVLPVDQKGQLREICNRIVCRHKVYADWGFDKHIGRSLNVLFSGPSGTGKTMAAGVIASELGLDLYKIDLSRVVSKYIGETEKNLGKIFSEAETSNAILFFDEADALFGKRSEIRDAHDRYANIEVGYLLQKMEEYDGMSILATNLRQNIDEAFLRRMQYGVEFPFPDEKHREEIWKGIFPAKARVSGDLDFRFLASKLKIAGGLIRNIALSAAFLAASSGSEITMGHIMRAAKREYAKTGSPFLKSDLEPYYGLVEDR